MGELTLAYKVRSYSTGTLGSAIWNARHHYFVADNSGGVAVGAGELFLSGIASVSNQVVWQRGLKVFLGGSESLSSMVVVLVVMLGLGTGAGWMGARSGRIARPMSAFASIELALFGVNLGIAFLLSQDLGPAVYALERFVLVLGVPLLFETGGEKRCDGVITVSAPPFVQRQRVLRRAGMTPENLKSILARQMPDMEKRKRSDFVVFTGLGHDYSLRQIQKIVRLTSHWQGNHWPPRSFAGRPPRRAPARTKP